MLRRVAGIGALAVALLGIYSVGDAGEKDKREMTLDGIKCLFCETQVSEDAFVAYKGGRLFFGCAGCPQAFEENKKKFATKANAQLVATRQARQKACPVSGNPHKKEFELAVGKAKVGFCCPNCKAATAKLEGAALLEKVFSEAAFKKAFEVPRAGKKKG